jgi:hypothetical protein
MKIRANAWQKVWAPQGSTGWYTHPGLSLIIVTAAVTAYDGDDPACKPSVYTKGMTFVIAEPF